jgi:hypothetical protein
LTVRTPVCATREVATLNFMLPLKPRILRYGVTASEVFKIKAVKSFVGLTIVCLKNADLPSKPVHSILLIRVIEKVLRHLCIIKLSVAISKSSIQDSQVFFCPYFKYF